jgi:hypothetical protein
LIQAIYAELDRQCPGVVPGEFLQAAIQQAVNGIMLNRANARLATRSEPPDLMGEEEQHVALDRIPGWEAA